MAPRFADGPANAAAIAAELTAAASEEAELVVFPEAALTGYLFESLEEGVAGAIEAGGPELTEVGTAAREAGVHAVVGAIEREGGALYNSAFLLGPEGSVGRYRKTHTLCLGVDRFTRAGTEPFRAFDLPIGRVGLHICYDGSFPEPARALRLEGARLLVLPTNWPRLELKPELVRVRAYENHAFYLAVNRVGEERGVRFEGGSLAADPCGRLLLHAGSGPGRFHVEMDLARADGTREVVSPGAYELDLIEDRRPDLYAALVREGEGAGRTGSRQSG